MRICVHVPVSAARRSELTAGGKHRSHPGQFMNVQRASKLLLGQHSRHQIARNGLVIKVVTQQDQRVWRADVDVGEPQP